MCCRVFSSIDPAHVFSRAELKINTCSCQNSLRLCPFFRSRVDLGICFRPIFASTQSTPRILTRAARQGLLARGSSAIAARQSLLAKARCPRVARQGWLARVARQGWPAKDCSPRLARQGSLGKCCSPGPARQSLLARHEQWFSFGGDQKMIILHSDEGHGHRICRTTICGTI